MKKTRNKLAQYLGLRIIKVTHQPTQSHNLKKKKKELISVTVHEAFIFKLNPIKNLWLLATTLTETTYTSGPLTTHPSDVCIGVIELHLTLFAPRWHQALELTTALWRGGQTDSPWVAWSAPAVRTWPGFHHHHL